MILLIFLFGLLGVAFPLRVYERKKLVELVDQLLVTIPVSTNSRLTYLIFKPIQQLFLIVMYIRNQL